MKFLVSGGARDLYSCFGVFVNPGTWKVQGLTASIPWGLDNDCYGREWNPSRHTGVLQGLLPFVGRACSAFARTGLAMLPRHWTCSPSGIGSLMDGRWRLWRKTGKRTWTSQTSNYGSAYSLEGVPVGR